MTAWMGRRSGIAAAVGTALLVLPLSAVAGIYGPSPPPPPGGGGGGSGAAAQVDAEGNPFTGGLGFDPVRVRVAVGQNVRWTNTDTTVPHTVTEEHGIFDLGGTYGPPGNMGFGPGESVELRLASGTFSYYCRVHPVEMQGVVAAPVRLSILRGRVARGTSLRIRAIWARAALPSGQRFDVQRRIGGGSWRSVRGGTRATGGRFAAVADKVNAFRARIRRAGASGGASGYSPPAGVRPG
jgi:plastocyanin